MRGEQRKFTEVTESVLKVAVRDRVWRKLSCVKLLNMAKWFKDFPTLKTGSDRLRSASESGAQTRPRPALSGGTGAKASPRKNSENAGGVGSLLSGRNRKNSAVELGRNHSSPGSGKDAKIWEILIPGKSKKNVKMEGFEDHRTLRTSAIADAYMSRMIKVEKQDKWQEKKYNSTATESTGTDPERGKTPVKTETVGKYSCYYSYYCV